MASAAQVTCPLCKSQTATRPNRTPGSGESLERAKHSSTCDHCGHTVDAQAEDDDRDRRIGTQVGVYHVLKVLGEGGMSIVYLAEHTLLGRKVALKTLRKAFAGDPKTVKRFFAEARAINRVRHKGVLEVTDFCENQNGDNYYVSEVLTGETLGQAMRKAGGILPIERTFRVAIQLASVLAAVHDANIVHRDLKPDNIFLLNDGDRHDFVKLIDFGVAKLMETDEDTLETSVLRPLELEQTSAGMVLGTPAYMSPEQARGEPIDSRSDMYSLGVILYIAICGKKPFHAKDFTELMMMRETATPEPPSARGPLPHAVPAELDALVMSLMANKVADRPQHMRDVHQRLRAIEEEELAVEIAAEPTITAEVVAPPRLSRLAAFVGVALLIALVVAVAAILKLRADSRAPTLITHQAPLPANVRIVFESTPPGATVFADGSDKPLGTTPVTLQFPRAQKRQQFIFKVEGYAPLPNEVSFAEDTHISVRFAERVITVPSASAASGAKGPHKHLANSHATKKPSNRRSFDSGAVLDDPFAN